MMYFVRRVFNLFNVSGGCAHDHDNDHSHDHIHGKHSHNEHKHNDNSSTGIMNSMGFIIASSLHVFSDGFALAASYEYSLPLGMTTT